MKCHMHTNPSELNVMIACNIKWQHWINTLKDILCMTTCNKRESCVKITIIPDIRAFVKHLTSTWTIIEKVNPEERYYKILFFINLFKSFYEMWSHTLFLVLIEKGTHGTVKFLSTNWSCKLLGWTTHISLRICILIPGTYRVYGYLELTAWIRSSITWYVFLLDLFKFFSMESKNARK